MADEFVDGQEEMLGNAPPPPEADPVEIPETFLDPTPLNLPEVLYEYLKENEGSWDKNGQIYASDLGVALGPEHSGCTLAFWLKCRNEPVRDKKPGELLMLRMGDVVHDYIARLVEKAVLPYGWYVEAVEERVTLEVELEGDEVESVGSRLDIRLRHILTGAVHVVDVKTKRGGAFRYLKDAKPGDVLQVQGYMKAADADTGSVLYVDREGQNGFREFGVDRNDQRPEEAVRRLVAIRDSETPPAPVGLLVTRKVNKGPDSVYLKFPWQIEWCDLVGCACRKALPCKSVPKGIVAKLHEQGDANTFEVRLTEDGAGLGDIILDLLTKKYPEERFTLKEEA